jgi:hypothetical protein
VIDKEEWMEYSNLIWPWWSTSSASSSRKRAFMKFLTALVRHSRHARAADMLNSRLYQVLLWCPLFPIERTTGLNPQCLLSRSLWYMLIYKYKNISWYIYIYTDIYIYIYRYIYIYILYIYI